MPRNGKKKKQATEGQREQPREEEDSPEPQEEEESWVVSQYNRVTNEMAQLVQARLGQMGDQDVNVTEDDMRVMRSMMINDIGMMTALIIKHRNKQPGERVVLKWDILMAEPQDAATQTDEDTTCVRSVAHKSTETDKVGETHMIRVCDTRPTKPPDGSVETDVQVPHEAHDTCDDKLAELYAKCEQIATEELRTELKVPIEDLPSKQLKERTVLIFRSHKRKEKRKQKAKAQSSVAKCGPVTK